MNILSTAEISTGQSALTVWSYLLNTAVAMPWVYCRLAIWGPDVIDGMVGLEPRLTGVTKAVAKSVALQLQ